MKLNTIIGMDISKTVFHIVEMNEKSRVLKRVKLTRSKVMDWLSNRAPSIVGIEACGGAHYLAKQIESLAVGHKVRIISPQFVVPYRKSQKNDFNDAEAIGDAVQRENMRFVEAKDKGQLTLQVLIRNREMLVGQKTQIINQIHGFLLEFGICIAKGRSALKKLPQVLWDKRELLSTELVRVIRSNYKEIIRLESEIKTMEITLEQNLNRNEKYKRLNNIPGIGAITSAMLLICCGNPHAFKNGRAFAAYLGLVPRQQTTGGKPKLGSITKRGNKQLRSLLALCAQSLLRKDRKKKDKLTDWGLALLKGKPRGKVIIALANKLARISWAVLAKDCEYDYNAQFVAAKA